MGMSVDGGTFTNSIHSVDKLFSEIKIFDFFNNNNVFIFFTR
jgi:hypothetical protein